MSALAGACLISGQAAADGVRLWGLFCAVMSAASYAAMVLTNKLAKACQVRKTPQFNYWLQP